ncbi:MMPL family transporter [Lysinibacillus sp. CNPSo 3705]|uniref:MMPL family transporter n=1 Tax=Lysinibacillus sp. CNPSo 3705 TaxID=3028148 RepID=UPI002363E5C5|nr:MMPL family transporter [Lysinibacillus sp. CNPSo 3705]MDD1502342.1 MMPL family transporter [Lysinibacillus sp. CNPSo 3705]
MKTFSAFITAHAKAIVALWFVIFITMAMFAIQLPSKLHGDGFFVKGDHTYVTNELAKTFDLPSDTILVVFNPADDKKIQDTLKKLENVKEIHSIQSPLDDASLQKNGIAYAMVHMKNNIDHLPDVVTDIRSLIEHDGVSITGGPVISADINTASQKDLASAEAIGLPIAIIVLLLAFGTVVASILPIIIGIVTVITAFGILTLFSGHINLSIFVLNIVPMLGLALSIDFALLFINRYREERAHTSSVQAIQTAIETAGRSIIFSAVCVMIGLGAMIVIDVEIFHNIALGGTIVVFLAVLSGLTLLPATMMLIGDNLNKWRLLRVKPGGANRWRGFAGFVMKHPVTIVIVALLLLGIGMIPLKDIKLTIPQVDSLPTKYDARAAYDQLDKTFGLGDTSTLYLLAERKEGWEDIEARELIFNIQEQLLDDPLVSHVSTIYTTANMKSPEELTASLKIPQAAEQLKPILNAFSKDKQLFIPITLDAAGSSTTAQQFARTWQDKDLGVDFALGGHAKFNQEIFDEISSKIFLAVSIIIVSTFFILMLAFRSILIPLKAIIMNIIGLSSAFGMLVYIFQYGHLGIEAGTIVLIIPVIVFCLVFGLSMDYEVFLISRIQEEYLKGADNTRATIDGLTSTSRIITSAALIMIVITGAFAFTDVMPVKQIGVGIAIAVAIDATIIRLMLVPSLMKLFGDWNWWLPFAKKQK